MDMRYEFEIVKENLFDRLRTYEGFKSVYDIYNKGSVVHGTRSLGELLGHTLVGDRIVADVYSDKAKIKVFGDKLQVDSVSKGLMSLVTE